MNSDLYSAIILITIFLNIISIVLSIVLLRDVDLKGGFYVIIFSLLTIDVILFQEIINFEKNTYDSVVLSPFDLISFTGSLILFLILLFSFLTKKYESVPLQEKKNEFLTSRNYFYRPKLVDEEALSEFHREKAIPEVQETVKKSGPETSETKTTQPIREKTERQKLETPGAKPQINAVTEKDRVSTFAEVAEKEKVSTKEIPTNGKAVVAKFIKKEEPRSEYERLKEELDKIKFQRDKLVSIISHDLRTPLTSVFGYCQLLKDGQYKNKNEVKKFAESIFELSKQQLNALNKIVEWTRYESSSLTLNPTEFDVTSTINFVAKSMTKIAEQKNIKIIVNSKPDLFVYGDEFMIIEVLKNLIDNAIKFSNPDSTIEIHTHYHEKINKLVVLVVDSGIGIDREILMNLLVSTKKYTTRGTKGEKGLGLGLLIVKAIIDKHGEHFWIASEEGKWTRVYFTLTPTRINDSKN